MEKSPLTCPISGFIDEPCKVGKMVVDETVRDKFLQLITHGLPQLTVENRSGWVKATVDSGVDRIPPNAEALFRNASRLDRVRRSVYMDSVAEVVYIADRGGVTDELKWYGPFKIESLPGLATLKRG